MSFPDFENEESNTNPTFNQEGYTEFNVDQSTNPLGGNWNSLGGNLNNSGRGDPMMQEAFDEEETERIAKRKQEETERRKAIEQKIGLELRLKDESRVKGMEYLNDFENKRLDTMNKRKQFNIQSEKESQSKSQLAKEGKQNPWEKVIEHITIKESDYKGTKNVSRMRNVLISKKNDMKK